MDLHCNTQTRCISITIFCHNQSLHPLQYLLPVTRAHPYLHNLPMAPSCAIAAVPMELSFIQPIITFISNFLAFSNHSSGRCNAAAFGKFYIDAMKMSDDIFQHPLSETQLSSANNGKGDSSNNIFIPSQSSFAKGCSTSSTPSSFNKGIFSSACFQCPSCIGIYPKNGIGMFSQFCHHFYIILLPQLLFYKWAMVFLSFLLPFFQWYQCQWYNLLRGFYRYPIPIIHAKLLSFYFAIQIPARHIQCTNQK